MPDRTAYDAALFAGTASYYRRYRSHYPPETFAYLRDRFPLAQLGCDVTGMDPDRAMLAEARLEASSLIPQTSSLHWLQGSSFNLAPALGAFHLVTMGQSFHWMDRDATVAALEPLIDRGGGDRTRRALRPLRPAHR